ncbi:MAG: PaaX family transcriptional regulator C-terminal domain-containing protein [Desulfitobacteriaceae bacterium]
MANRFPLSTQSILFTLFGDYVYSPKLNRAIWVGSLINLLKEFGHSEQAFRLSFSRMYSNGWLERQKKGVRSYYAMSEKGLQLMIDSEKRIFPQSTKTQGWDGHWFLVGHIQPNEDSSKNTRDIRYELRRELKWLGFGTLSSNIWISPYDYKYEVQQIFKKLNIIDSIEIFTATHDGYALDRILVTKCWDLSKTNAAYRQFLNEYSSRLTEIKSQLEKREFSDSQCFFERVMLVTQYRKFPFSDPGLPEELLLPDWLGIKATNLFTELHDLLAPGAFQFFYNEINR